MQEATRRADAIPHARSPQETSLDEGITSGRNALETRGLTKRYGSITAVESLDLQVRRGEVYGFLGPNGAGKTTTLRMLLGLIRPSAGSALVLGHRPGEAQSLREVGALVEAAAFYPFLSGRDNLRVMTLHAGVSAARVGPVLERVGLSGRSDDAFHKYSLGMKQRLGVAAALLKEPELLILDEPTNGLDAEGMVEMRELVRSLRASERTVLLSSHLMTEVEQVCDRVGVIRNGRLVAEGTIDELRGEERLRLRATPVDLARAVLARLPGVAVREQRGGLLMLSGSSVGAGAINRALVEAEVVVHELTSERSSLETIFLELTQKTGEPDVE